jgi:diacylglycerol O-acyltransferase / wax synthase
MTAHASPAASRTVDVHMRETDSFSWTMERDPLLRMPIVVVARLDGTPGLEHLRDRFERLTRAVPMFRQKVVEPPLRLAPPKWVVDADFDLSWHVRRIQAPTPATFDIVLDLARQIGTAGFDPVRPMWEATLVEGMDGGRSALIIKVHHTLTDGIGGMQLLLHVFDVDRTGVELGEMPPPPEAGTGDASLADAVDFDVRQLLTIARTVTTTLWRGVRHPRATITGLLSTGRSAAEVLAPANVLLSPVMIRRGLGRRYAPIDVPLAGLKQAGRMAGGTVNDAFLGAVTGGLRRYHELHGEPVELLRMTLPISTRAEGDPEEGNRIALVRDVLPVGISDPVERIRADAERAAHWKEAPALPHMEVVTGAVNRLPAAYLQGLAKHVDFVASNVPGIPVPMFCDGIPVLSLYPFGPTGGSAVNVTLLTYRDTCHIGVNMDVLAVPDGEVFMECMRAGFGEVLEIADRASAGGAAGPSGRRDVS